MTTRKLEIEIISSINKRFEDLSELAQSYLSDAETQLDQDEDYDFDETHVIALALDMVKEDSIS